MSTCARCQYLRDFRSLKLGLRCFNINNSPKPGNFLEITSTNYSCNYFKPIDLFNPIEFDPKKDKINEEKHGISLVRAADILADPKNLQILSPKEKWEDFSNLNFEDEGIEKNTRNLDPIRGTIIGHIDKELYLMVYTFRHEIGDMKYRVLSLRRANKKEVKMYHQVRNEKQGEEK
ncbi:MAG: BrnT family toxin [Bacteriovoracia bacterium]